MRGKTFIDEKPLFGFLMRETCDSCGHVCGVGGCSCWYCWCCRDDCCCKHKNDPKPEAR